MFVCECVWSCGLKDACNEYTFFLNMDVVHIEMNLEHLKSDMKCKRKQRIPIKYIRSF